MKKILLALAMGAFLTMFAAPAVLAGGDNNDPHMVPKKCNTTWGAVKAMYRPGAGVARCK